MGKCLIFCAGGFDGLIEEICSDDYIVAADGGYAHTQALGIKANLVLGDFDSLGYVPQEATQFPVEKDDTDTMLALRHGLELGYDRFLLYGCLDGPRLDHTLANFQALQFLADRSATGWLIGKDYIATVVKNQCLRFDTCAQGIISVFCMGGDAHGVTISGLKYSLTDGTLTAGFPLGVSNHFTGSPASVSVDDGSLLVLYHKQNGLGIHVNSR